MMTHLRANEGPTWLLQRISEYPIVVEGEPDHVTAGRLEGVIAVWQATARECLSVKQKDEFGWQVDEKPSVAYWNEDRVLCESCALAECEHIGEGIVTVDPEYRDGVTRCEECKFPLEAI
jgi:hypothetical protein